MASYDGLSNAQISALKPLCHLWPEVPVVLIGGVALAFSGKLSHRTTEDLDLVVAIPIPKVDRDLASLEDWKHSEDVPHRWHAPDGVRVDILPVPVEALASGRIHWPGGTSMSVRGFQHLETRFAVVQLDTDVRIRVADPTVLLFLKMVSYLERPADRLRDLKDIAHLLDHHGNDERLFAPELVDLQIPEDEAGAYLAGKDLGGVLDKFEADIARRFASRVLDYSEDDGFAQKKMTQLGPPSWQEDPDRVLKVMRAFLQGLGSAEDR